jgi:hypothetical protein
MEHRTPTTTNQSEPQSQTTCCAKPQSSQPEAVHSFRDFQQRIGNNALGRLIQAKLKVSEPGDAYEREADRVADEVMRMPEPGAESEAAIVEQSSIPQIQRMCNDCEEEEHAMRKTAEEEKEEEDKHVQKKESASNTGAENSNDVQSITGGGHSLSESTRAFFEPRFGHDFDGVRIHNDGAAANSARALNALAFTAGRDIVFAAGQYSPESSDGKKLLAHELTHVVQQTQAGTPRADRKLNISRTRPVNDTDVFRATDETAGATGTQANPAGGAPAGGAPAGGAPARGGFEIDVLAAEGADDFLVRAARRALGVDIHVMSMDDMISQVETRATAGTCVRRLNIFNHANPSQQMVAGGQKIKTATGEKTQAAYHGFSINWLTANANQAALNRLRHSFCCDGQMNWWGCSTAGVWSGGGTRTAAEQAEDQHRYTGVMGEWYHNVEDAAAHGAMAFKYIGPVNVQSWANALCVPVVGATDFTNWRTVGDEVIRTVIHGGRQVRTVPQADIACGCDPATSRISGSVQTSAQLEQRATELREQFLRPLYERARSPLGTAQPAVPETPAERTTREAGEQAQAQAAEQLGNTIQDAVLSAAGFAAGAKPANPAEALRVVNLWGLTIDNFVSTLPTLTTSLSGMLRGSHEEGGLDQQQRDLEAAMKPAGRESFMAALTLVRNEKFWDDYLKHNTVYIFPDLTGVNRYRGFTQTATRTVEGSRPQTIFVIHVSKDLLEQGQTELVAANIVHELSHSAYRNNQVGQAMQKFDADLAGLLVDHPQIAALRTSAADPAALRNVHLSRIRQMLYEVTGYGEEEIFVHLQQLTHQPAMTVNTTTIRGSDFVLQQVELFMRRLRKIGMPVGILNTVLGSIRRQAIDLYDRRIAMSPVGSPERKNLELSKEQAILIFQMALTDSARAPGTP